eukprot:CAMPEP_0194346776 /NCGR_PEP_ID=MMETSP0171-20130528/105617_1 /TAXON_ID=218684 /ORGANISM="Corethron pennatum, Strain L29A3" /LENGTH=149 /DNA_ID=CAMNT_0039113941 /DNA_START=193 /DNA_END=642 /DNA_ORIENTATION=+
MSFIGFPAAEVRDLLRSCLDSCGVCGGHDANRPAHHRALSLSHRPAHRGANNMSLCADDVGYRNCFWRPCSAYFPQMCVGISALGFTPPKIRDLGGRCWRSCGTYAAMDVAVVRTTGLMATAPPKDVVASVCRDNGEFVDGQGSGASTT